MFPVLETERLTLREIKEEDAPTIFDCFSIDEVIRFYGQEPLRDIAQAKQLVEFFATNYKEKRGIRWGIELKGTHSLIGTVGFNGWIPKHKRAEIGYEIHPKYWRKGYTTEAVLKVLSYGFEVMELTRIGAVVFLENGASNKLLTKVGFQKEGILRDYMYQNDKAHDTYVYSLLRK
ncbi:GNAT family protein [Alkalihalophilus lindianensis]|uniref:GNAT family protein n=1 Tax=Alkalihalophilus lindianensis TaxID=1630542 RepID=A0ABU3XCM7_9BACI|nr:GNAT family protein [Alkalihalophilus lindianensis]MDV2685646.1 GNAT family protein [Alkalihalophilus lindianensis]